MFQMLSEFKPHSAFGWKSPVVGVRGWRGGQSPAPRRDERVLLTWGWIRGSGWTSGSFCTPGPGEGDDLRDGWWRSAPALCNGLEVKSGSPSTFAFQINDTDNIGSIFILKILLLIWNANLPGHPWFLFAKSGNARRPQQELRWGGCLGPKPEHLGSALAGKVLGWAFSQILAFLYPKWSGKQGLRVFFPQLFHFSRPGALCSFEG